MDIKKLIERLNELYRESKARTLTVEELQERDELRKEYIGLIKDQVRCTIDQIEIVDEQGDPIHHDHDRDHKH